MNLYGILVDSFNFVTDEYEKALNEILVNKIAFEKFHDNDSLEYIEYWKKKAADIQKKRCYLKELLYSELNSNCYSLTIEEIISIIGDYKKC